MKIIKFGQFLESKQDTPESYSESLITVLKRKIDKMFGENINDGDTSGADDNRPDNNMDIKKAKMKKAENQSFKDLGLRLDSSEISKYSRVNDSLTVKFSDDRNTYTLIIMLNTEDIVKNMTEKEEDEDFSIKDIKTCYLKFKKYDLDTIELIGQITKNVEVDKVDENFIIELKIEIDETFDDEIEDFKIETE